jgi:hypothetical protein
MGTRCINDSGSNMDNACIDWGIPHFPCVGNFVHLILGPLLVEKKEETVFANDD